MTEGEGFTKDLWKQKGTVGKTQGGPFVCLDLALALAVIRF